MSERLTVGQKRQREREQAEKAARKVFEKLLANAQVVRYSVMEVGVPITRALNRIYDARENHDA